MVTVLSFERFKYETLVHLVPGPLPAHGKVVGSLERHVLLDANAVVVPEAGEDVGGSWVLPYLQAADDHVRARGIRETTGT